MQNIEEYYLICCRAFSHCSSLMDECTHVFKDCAVLLLFFFLTFLHKPVPQDSASSRILCPCITSCDDLASFVQQDYEVHHETRGSLKKKKKKYERTDCRQHVFLSCVAPVKDLPDAPRLRVEMLAFQN